MECIQLITVKHNGKAHKVPCGKCAFCLTNKRSQWMFRLYHEMRNQTMPGYFITLTYAEHMVPRLDDGRLTLRFRHCQLYLKKLRKHKWKAKYILVGEYGGETQRPHYHAILWTDCPPEKLESFWSNSRGKVRGRIHIGSLSMASCMYTLKYIIQPKVREQEAIGPDGLTVQAREKTRAQFSKGLGLQYLTAQVYDWHTCDYDEPRTYSYIEGRKLALPRYYKNKIFTKYQMQKEASKNYWNSIRELRKNIRKFRDQGIADPINYMKGLRNEAALAIIRTTKGQQTI